MTGLLIVGASQAGVQLVASLRALGYDEPITLLGEEDHRPYQRPALSKEFLQDKVGKESLIFRSQEYWDEHRVAAGQGRADRARRAPGATARAPPTRRRAGRSPSTGSRSPSAPAPGA